MKKITALAILFRKSYPGIPMYVVSGTPEKVFEEYGEFVNGFDKTHTSPSVFRTELINFVDFQCKSKPNEPHFVLVEGSIEEINEETFKEFIAPLAGKFDLNKLHKKLLDIVDGNILPEFNSQRIFFTE